MRVALIVVVALAFPLASACVEGPFGGPPPPKDIDDPNDPDDPDDPDDPIEFAPETPAPATRVFRLSREQWENSVRDLLRLDERTGYSSEIAEDSLPAGSLFDNPSDSLSVDETQWAGFQRAAARTAEFATIDPTRFAALVPDGADETSRARTFIEEFGLRAHRRPLSVPEIDRYMVVYEAGRTGFAAEGVDPFVGGIRLIVEAMLQSPFFLYRVEQSEVVDDTGVIPLDGFERASRLSYALYNSMPDDELFVAAADGTLDDPTGVETAARRMLDDERAVDAMQHFFAQLFEMEKLAGVAPSQVFFPDVPADFGALARTEAELFLAHVFTEGGGLTDVLTSTTTFANADLARVYGVNVASSDASAFEQVELDATQRRGVFTHVAFLVQNASAVDPDPIHRGVFLAKNMACIPISAPPADIPPLPPLEDLETNRERVEKHTQVEGSVCANCHSQLINPFGFPYEMFDATGAYRTHDNGLPVDTSSQVFLDDFVNVDDALDLAEAMATSRYVHECAAQHWVEFSLGRQRKPEDDGIVQRLGDQSLNGASTKDLLARLVTSPAFLARNAAELDDGTDADAEEGGAP